MKKLFLLCFTALTLAGCEPFCAFDYVIINQTQSTIIFTDTMSDNQTQTTIAPYVEQTVYKTGDLCGDTGKLSDPYYGYDEQQILHYVTMTINGQLVSDAIWKRKYWEFSSEKTGLATYSLIVTDALLLLLETEL